MYDGDRVIGSGKTRIIYVNEVSVGAGNVTCSLAPDSGKCWKVLAAWGYQTSGGNRAAQWFFHDPENDRGLANSVAALATTTTLVAGSIAAGGSVWLPQPVWLYESRYLSFVFTATGAAENGYALAIVEEFEGVVVV